jgi:hypothetical protein
MLIQSMNYDIHGILTLQVNKPVRRAAIPLNLHALSHFMIDKEPIDLTIRLNLADFNESLGECILVDHKYHIRRNYLFCRDESQNRQWKIEIKGLEEDRLSVQTKGNSCSLRDFFSPEKFEEFILLKQVINSQLLLRGYCLVSAGGIGNGKDGLLLFGRGGSYKTSLLMQLMRQGKLDFFGDDVVIISRNEIFSFPVYQELFKFRLQNMTREKFTTISRLHLLLSLMIKKDKSRLRIGGKCRLTKVIQLVVGRSDEVELSACNPGEAWTCLKNVSQAEEYGSWNMGYPGAFPRYKEAYAYVFPQNSLDSRWDDFFHSPPEFETFKLLLPAHPTQGEFQSAALLIVDLLTT